MIGLRGKSLNVYWKGQSIFKVEAGPLSLRASTHEKFLLDPKLGGQIDFDGEKFDVAALGTKAFLKHKANDAGSGRRLFLEPVRSPTSPPVISRLPVSTRASGGQYRPCNHVRSREIARRISPFEMRRKAAVQTFADTEIQPLALVFPEADFQLRTKTPLANLTRGTVPPECRSRTGRPDQSG